MSTPNGHYKEQLDKIQDGVDEIKDNLAISIDRLTVAVNNLAEKVEYAVVAAKEVIPVKVVFWMWIIMLVGLVGIEGVKHIPKLAGIL